MSASTLIRAARSDNNETVLVHVTPADNGDLQLLATENEATYKTLVQQSRLSDYKHNHFDGSDKDLERIFSSLFCRTPPPHPAVISGIELSVSVGKNKDHLAVSIRKNIGGISRGVADIKIPKVDTDDVDTFIWASESCLALDKAKDEAKAYKSQVESKDRTIASLTGQLETLTTLKKEHEELLLVKFKELLNTKKAKIRQLSRDLENARAANDDSENKVGTGFARASPTPEPKPEPAPTKGRRKAAPKAAAKNKAAAPAARKRKPVAPPSDSESDGGFVVASAPARSTRGRSKAKSATPQPMPAPEDDASPTASEDEAQQSDRRSSEDELPPVRKPIAFGITKKAAEPAPPTPASAPAASLGEETDDDDEL